MLWLLAKVLTCMWDRLCLLVTLSSVLVRFTLERMLLPEMRFTMRSAELPVPIPLTVVMTVLPLPNELLPTVPPMRDSDRNMTWLVLTPRRLILEPFTRLLGRFMLLFEVLSAARGHPLPSTLTQGCPVSEMVPLGLVGVRL